MEFQWLVWLALTRTNTLFSATETMSSRVSASQQGCDFRMFSFSKNSVKRRPIQGKSREFRKVTVVSDAGVTRRVGSSTLVGLRWKLRVKSS